MRRAFRTQPGLACCDILIANLPISGRCGEASQVGKSSPERVRGAAATENDFVSRRWCRRRRCEYWNLFAVSFSLCWADRSLFTRLNLRRRISGACSLPRASLQMCAYRSLPWANPAGELHSTFRINATSIIACICPKEIHVIRCLSK